MSPEAEMCGFPKNGSTDDLTGPKIKDKRKPVGELLKNRSCRRHFQDNIDRE